MRKPLLTVGIDPGKTGAVAVMDVQKQRIVHVWDAPVVKGERGKDDRYHLRSMCDILNSIINIADGDQDIILAVLEHPIAKPGQDSSTIMKTGYSFGLWEMGLEAFGYKYRTVYPITWAKALFEGLTDRTKMNSYEVAKANFPDAEFVTPGTRKKKPMDGRTDAMCIALFAARFL